MEECRDKRKIKYLVMDVDGTLTDGKIYISPSGEAMKAFDVKDGYAINHMLRGYGITPVIITGRSSDIVINRCRELNITEVYQGVADKFQSLLSVIGGEEELNFVAVIGDDIPDLSMMQPVKEACGLVGCPADAVEAVKSLADYISPHNGGDGAVRDFIEWLCE